MNIMHQTDGHDALREAALRFSGIKKTPESHTISIVRDESYRGTTLIRSHFARTAFSGHKHDRKDNGFLPIASNAWTSHFPRPRCNNSGALKNIASPSASTQAPIL